MNWGRSVWRMGAAAAVASMLLPANSGAQTSDAAREAGQHFRRGVELYGEANYAGALVEFKRAYALASSSTALYDIGETQFQLQDYAGALQTFKKFLAEFGPGENHHAEVEAGVQVLATRVGHLRVTSVPAGADVAVDDEAIGKTPLAEPLLVSVGHRKVVASMPGREPVTRYVDVAAGDEADVTLALPEPVQVAPPSFPSTEHGAAPAVGPPRWHASSTLVTAGWITTGALAAAAGTFGLLAIHESDELKQARAGLQPAVPSGSNPAAPVDQDAHEVRVFAAVADSLTIAAIVSGGLSLYWTLSSLSAPHNTGAAPATRISFGPASARFETTF
jgi:hypothetical protein